MTSSLSPLSLPPEPKPDLKLPDLVSKSPQNYVSFTFKASDIQFSKPFILFFVGVTNLSKNLLFPKIVLSLKSKSISFSNLIFYINFDTYLL